MRERRKASRHGRVANLRPGVGVGSVGLGLWCWAGRGRSAEGRAEEEREEAENCEGPFHGVVGKLVDALMSEDRDGDGGVVAAADFGDEAAEFAEVVVFFDAGIGFCVSRLEAEEFAGGLLGDGMGGGDFFAAVAPEFEGVVAGDEKPFIFGADRGFEREFLAHTFLLCRSRSKWRAKDGKLRECKNLVRKSGVFGGGTSTKVRVGDACTVVNITGRETRRRSSPQS